MKALKEILKKEINNRISEKYIKASGGIAEYYRPLKKNGWLTPQPLYNIVNGDANLTFITAYEIGMADPNFSADYSIFGEYRMPDIKIDTEKDLLKKENEQLKNIIIQMTMEKLNIIK